MGSEGEATMLGPGEGRTFPIGQRRITVKLDTTAGAPFAAFESAPAVGEPGPPPHRHQAYDEAFYVLEGIVEFQVVEQTVALPAGSFAHVPPGVTHTFRNPGPDPARMLIIVAPPAALTLVERFGALVADAAPPDPAAVRTLFAEHRTELVAPPSADERPTV